MRDLIEHSGRLLVVLVPFSTLTDAGVFSRFHKELKGFSMSHFRKSDQEIIVRLLKWGMFLFRVITSSFCPNQNLISYIRFRVQIYAFQDLSRFILIQRRMKGGIIVFLVESLKNNCHTILIIYTPNLLIEKKMGEVFSSRHTNLLVCYV